MAPLPQTIARMIHRHHDQSSSKSRLMRLFIIYEFPLLHFIKHYPKHRKRLFSHHILDRLSETKITMASSIPDDFFRAFHSVDRSLYTVLVDRLGRDPAQSMQVMALWLWLERMSHDQHFMHRILELPHSLINYLADEAVLILNCVESDDFLISQEELDSWYSIELTQSHVRNMEVTIPFFHRNRLMVNRGVTQLLNEVCYRAFYDLMHNARAARATASPAPEIGSSRLMPMPGPSSFEVGSSSTLAHPMSGSSSFDAGSGSQANPPPGSVFEIGSSSRGNRQPRMMPTMIGSIPLYGPVPFLRIGSRVGLTMPPTLVQPADRIVDPNVPGAGVRPEVPLQAPLMFQAMNSFDLRGQRQLLREEELSALMNSLILNNEGDEENQGQNINAEQEQVEQPEEVPAIDRTLFITFSKGYPVTMEELREFFTGFYGDCIEGLHPQEVGPGVQPLFARMVMRSADVLHQILRGQVKVKYTINRRHVWARKFVPKFKPRRR